MSPFCLDQPKFDGKNGPFARQSWNRPMPPTRQGHPDSVGFVWICRLFRTEARQAKIDLPAEKPDTIFFNYRASREMMVVVSSSFGRFRSRQFHGLKNLTPLSRSVVFNSCGFRCVSKFRVTTNMYTYNMLICPYGMMQLTVKTRFHQPASCWFPGTPPFIKISSKHLFLRGPSSIV